MKRWQIAVLAIGLLVAIGAFIGVSLQGRPETSGSVDIRTIAKGDEYVAIGDSFTAAPALRRPTNACLRTTTNYPHLVAEKLGLSLKDVSCAGAATKDVRAAQTLRTTRVPPQGDALSRSTDIATIGLGGNDFNGFRTITLTCSTLRLRDPEGAPCEEANSAAHGQGQSIEKRMVVIEQRLVDVIRYAAKRAPSARIIVVGYPEFFPERGPCAQLPLALGDYPFAHRFNELLVRAQKRAAERTGVEYIDVFTPSRGHDMCAQEPWIAGRRSTRAEAMPLHPFHEMQQLVARLLLERIR